MKSFIELLTIEQIQELKNIVDIRYTELIKTSKLHIRKGFEEYSKTELKQLIKKYNNQQNYVRNNKEYDELQVRIDIASDVLNAI